MKKTPKQKTQDNYEIAIESVQMHTAQFWVLGHGPYVQNRPSEKARQQLLLPSQRRSKAELNVLLKHDPVREFQSSMYRQFKNDQAATRIVAPTNAFLKAMATVASDIPGSSRAQILRLTSIIEPNTNIYGIPHLYMTNVRLQGMNRSLDIRTRAIFPRWACPVAFRFMRPILTEKVIANLFAAAGQLIGIGDERTEKGESYGMFRPVNEDDPELLEVIRTGGLAAQDKAIANPICFNEETEELLSWYDAELIRRERQPEKMNGQKNDRRSKTLRAVKA